MMRSLRRPQPLACVLTVTALAMVLGVAPAGTAPAAPAGGGPTPRHISAGAYADIRDSASRSVAAHPGCTGLTVDRLTATALAIVFKESGSGLSKAPSPMTLSRFDVYKPDGGTYQRLNYGLYAFRDVNTPYQQAFWHPGVGMWQMDEAGLGAPFTAAERIDTRISTTFVVDYLGDQWCTPGSPPSITAGRQRAWGDWGCRQSSTNAQCRTLETLYLELYVDGGLAKLIKDPIARSGGATARTCRVAGGVQVPCLHVDPALAQGDTWWRSSTLNGATPIAKPFYVVEHAGKEQRIWLSIDTGYPIDITATRTIGRNSRPYQTGDGLTWDDDANLCDLTTGRGGSCDPNTPSPQELAPPSPPQRRVLSAPAGRQAVVGDYDGDGLDDVIWYAAGDVSDSLWTGTGAGTFQQSSTAVDGAYVPVTAHLDPDGFDDVLWHDRGTGRVVRWDSLGDGRFAKTTLQVGVSRTPLVGDFDGDGLDEVLWYRAGANDDPYWDVAPDGTLSATVNDVRGTYQPLVGDFDGNDVDDIFWYGAGAAPDSLWMHSAGGARTNRSVSVKGTYAPAVGDFDGDGHADVYWYAAGPGSDTMWFGVDGSSWATMPAGISGTYDLVVADVDGNGRDDLTLYAQGFGSDRIWRFGAAPGRTRSEVAVRIDGEYGAVRGALGTAGSGGALWWAPSGYTVVWYP